MVTKKSSFWCVGCNVNRDVTDLSACNSVRIISKCGASTLEAVNQNTS